LGANPLGIPAEKLPAEYSALLAPRSPAALPRVEDLIEKLGGYVVSEFDLQFGANEAIEKRYGTVDMKRSVFCAWVRCARHEREMEVKVL